MHDSDDALSGPIEVDEAYFGGKEANKHKTKKLNTGRGAVGKTAVAGIKDRKSNEVRAKVVEDTTAKTLQGFAADNVNQDATVFSDDSISYSNLLFDHESVTHSVGENVREQADINGIESFWATLK